MTLISIIGGGQLGRMLALAGYPLGLRFRCLDPVPDSPTGQLAEQVLAAYDDPDGLDRLAEGAELVTYEFENVPVEAAQRLAERVPVFPPPAALAAAQDRLIEKRFFQARGIPTPPFLPIDSFADLEIAAAQIGLPAVLKTRRLGYDGKGQWLVRTQADLAAAWAESGGVPLILEGFVAFQRELSILAARGRTGEIACYPLIQNEHQGGILRLSRAPAPHLEDALQTQAETYAHAVLEELGYVGMLAIELFEVDGQLLANEMAPRVHNSGHWTIEGAETSQFEQHLRAILGMPLGSTAPHGHAAMINLIGDLPDSTRILAIPGAHLHLYGKNARPGRKVGHITLVDDDTRRLKERIDSVRGIVDAPR